MCPIESVMVFLASTALGLFFITEFIYRVPENRNFRKSKR
jgi:hypothetical protein